MFDDTGSLVFLLLAGDVVNSVDDIGWLAVLVGLANGMSLEVQVVGMLLGAFVPALVKGKVLL